MKFAFCDFEYHDKAELDPILVCASVRCVSGTTDTYERGFWLYQRPSAHREAKAFFQRIIDEGYIFVSYSYEAEYRSLMALWGGPLPKPPKAVDLYLEYRCLLNHNHKLAYGKQYIGGAIITTKPPKPKWERDDSEGNSSKPSFGLAGSLFKLLNLQIDTQEKEEVRSILIEGHPEKITANADRIQRYCKSDVVHLLPLQIEIQKQFINKGIGHKEWLNQAILRADYAARTAVMVRTGYPINADKVAKFTANIDNILDSARQDVLQFQDEVKAFRHVTKTGKWVMNEKEIRTWAEAQKKPYWRKTEKQKTSISKDAFRDWYNADSDGFAGAFCRYLKTKQSLNGFMPGGTRGKFSDFCGSDNRVRPYFGIYGSQSSRSQPSSTGFIPLKAHWMRNFIEAPSGRALCSIDYASQEFLIAAILSQDEVMMAAYASGDVYLAFAKSSGLVPAEATKESHKAMRDACKELVLGMSYDMTEIGLAPKLSARLGREVTKHEAQELIDLFRETYRDYSDWKDGVSIEYQESNKLGLIDGWQMWGDNGNGRSVKNFKTQGTGAVIMREAVRMAQNRGLAVLYTNHDSLTIEFDSYDTDKILLLMTCMSDAFMEVMGHYGRVIPIRLDGEAWSKDYAAMIPPRIDGVKYLPEYVDEKGQKDLKRFREFFS